jgi:hypothetical protein
MLQAMQMLAAGTRAQLAWMLRMATRSPQIQLVEQQAIPIL